MDREQQVEWARRYLVDNWQCQGGQRGRKSKRSWGHETEDRGTVERFASLPYRILAASPHLQGISGHEEILDKLLESMPLLEALEILERELG
jgi:hypothetical protein